MLLFWSTSDDIKSEAAAQKAVADLAETAKHLIQDAQKQTTASERLEQVLNGGKPVTDKNNGEGDGKPKPIPADKLDAMSTDELVALQENDPQLYEASLAAAAASEGD